MLHILPQEIVTHLFQAFIPNKYEREECLRALRSTCKYYRYWVDTKGLLKLILKVEVEEEIETERALEKIQNTLSNNNKIKRTSSKDSRAKENPNNTNNNKKKKVISLSQLEQFLRRASLKRLPLILVHELRIEGGCHLTAEDFSNLACLFHLLKQTCANLFNVVLYSFNNLHKDHSHQTSSSSGCDHHQQAKSSGTSGLPENYDPYYDTLLNLNGQKDEAWTTDDLVKYLPFHLQSLCLYNCLDLTDFGLNELKHTVPHLRYLDVRYCNPNLTDEGMKSLPDTLEELTLFNYSNLTDRGLKYMKILRKSEVRLKSLRLSRTRVTPEGVKRYVPSPIQISLWSSLPASPERSSQKDLQLEAIKSNNQQISSQPIQ